MATMFPGGDDSFISCFLVGSDSHRRYLGVKMRLESDDKGKGTLWYQGRQYVVHVDCISTYRTEYGGGNIKIDLTTFPAREPEYRWEDSYEGL